MDLTNLTLAAGMIPLDEGLPLSIQIIGKPFAKRQILEIGKAFQDESGFNTLRPDPAPAAQGRKR